MTEEKKGGPAAKIGVVLALVLLAACCGCGGIVLWGPGWLVGLFLEDEPMDVPDVGAGSGILEELDQRFQGGGEVRISGEELSQLVDPSQSLEVEAFHVSVEGDQAELDISLYMHESGQRYLNVHLVGEAEVEQGWLTHLQVDELTVSGWELGPYLAGQEQADRANQRLADLRTQHPEVAAFMDEIEHATIEGGQVVVTLEDGGYGRILAIEPP